MSESAVTLDSFVHRVLARLHGAIATMSDGDGRLGPAVTFLYSLQERYVDGEGRTGTPIELLREAFSLTEAQTDALVLAGLADEHEGLTHLFRLLDPHGRPYPTLGLIIQVLFPDPEQRKEATLDLATGVLAVSGIIRLDGDDPLYDRSVRLADQLWPVLNGIDIWPIGIEATTTPVATAGLRSWLRRSDTRNVAKILHETEPNIVLVTADQHDVAAQRAAALATHSAIASARLAIGQPPTPGLIRLLSLHALVRDVIPLITVPDSDQAIELVDPPNLTRPVVVCATHGSLTVRTQRPLITLRATPLSASDRRLMWSEILPELATQAPELASRHPVEPSVAATVAADTRSGSTSRTPTLAAVSQAIRARGIAVPGGGVSSITPTARWDDLVLPDRQEKLLQSAVARLKHHSTVLDEWGFLANRGGARGVRMLFAGPPGTGKTLSAEVLASALGGLDLLVVDISKIVSKWIGETEKNLARVFDLAENSVLFFDEADALFGRRTQVSDAHDRYANLETAYLLTRLERFEGLAILATNLKANIDPAFLRRMEFVVDFREPGPTEREKMWRRHVPREAPIARDVDFAALGTRFPVVGGLIRNAAVGAAFIAADSDSPIAQEHFVTAMQMEYEKTGLAYPTSHVRGAG